MVAPHTVALEPTAGAPAAEPRGHASVLDGLDTRLIELLAPVVRRLLGGYFRAEVHGLEHVPAGPAIIAGNHNGGITFLEPLIFGAEFYLRRGTGERLYAMAHDAVMAIPLVGGFVRRIGALHADNENARAVLDAGHKLVVFPGGNHEAWRPWRERHRVDLGGHKGFARLALERNVPVVPMVSVGGHDGFVVLTRGEPLAKLLRTDKLLRSKAFPVFLAIPWGVFAGPMFHLPAPVKCTVELGEPIDPQKAVGHLPPEQQVDALYELVQTQLQTAMDRIVGGR